MNPRNFKFCPRCGDRLMTKYIENEDTERLVCRGCQFIFYINPTPAVAVILVQDEKILLVKRKYEPRKDEWTLPAGFMEYNELAEQTALREAKEETNLDIAIDGFFGVYPGFDDPRVHVVLIVFRGKILRGQARPGDDASEIGFFSFNELPEKIAFHSHQQILTQLKEYYQPYGIL
ncbi:MAG: NUDIX domain-containing protein [Candidatus Zhuqueibacterota bacterium]